MSSEQLKGHLDSLILAVLHDGPAHGYAVIDELRTRSQGRFELPEGTIYPALHRLESAGAVTSQREVVNGRERRVYRIAPSGRTSLRAQRTTWRNFSNAVSLVLGTANA